jgi:hypothetical protein
METDKLLKILKEFKKCTPQKHHIGVYAADKLPIRLKIKPAAIIAHSEVASEYVGHWYAIYVSKSDSCAYFDSFGREPFVENHIRFMSRLSKSFTYSKTRLQNPSSNVCGVYVLVFLGYKMGLIEFKRTGKLLGKNRSKNDNIVVEALCSFLRKRRKLALLKYVLQLTE